MTMRRRIALLALALFLGACAGDGRGDRDGKATATEPTTARAAQAQFDALCATRPERAAMERALQTISGDQAIETVVQREFLAKLGWHLRPSPPGAASALKGGGKRFSGSGLPLLGQSFVGAAVYLDGDGRVLGCRSSILYDGP